MTKDTFNDRMVKKTVIPAIYLWLLASGAVVGMGILYPDVVLANLDGFIALIAIIGGVAAPALQTVLRMWESEQQIEMTTSTPNKNTAESDTPHSTNTKWNLRARISNTGKLSRSTMSA